MLKRILVALDRSDMVKQVFEQGLALAKLTQAHLLLLHVLSSEEEGSPYIPVLSNMDYYPGWNGQHFELYQRQWEKFKHAGLEMLQSFCAEANREEVNTEFRQVLGNPSRKICELATIWNADLIMMGRRGRSGITEVLLGSVSNYVVHHAPCSVHIVHLPIKHEDMEQPMMPSTEKQE